MAADRGDCSDSPDSNGYCSIYGGRRSINDSRELRRPDAPAVRVVIVCLAKARIPQFRKNVQVWRLVLGENQS